MSDKKNESITSRDIDFAQWYTDVVRAAKLANYSNVKGCMVVEPNGTALWENIQKILDTKFKESGHQNVMMPMLIPENLMKKEGELIEGFAPEVAWVTMGGSKHLEERLCIRPTSETLFSDYYSSIVNSYRDLPLKYNQWCNVMRWEKETRPFLRTREFFWQEGHTVHASAKEAQEETNQMLETYRNLFENYLAIPVVSGKKTEKEKFAGAEYTLTIEALMYNGISLQSATSHYFGQKFSKAYDIKFLNKEGKLEYAYQTSWGATTRMIGAIIMVHGDDNGLILPPKIAPKQVVIVGIGKNDEEVDTAVTSCYDKLKEAGISVYVDNSERSPGFKFAEAEVNGIPIRLEIGKRDLSNKQITVARRDTREKLLLDYDDNLVNNIKNLMDDIQNNMYNKARQRMESLTYKATTFEEIEKIMNTQPGFVYANWCGDKECELKMKEIRGTKSRCIKETYQGDHNHTCVVCGKKAKHNVIWGIQY